MLGVMLKLLLKRLVAGCCAIGKVTRRSRLFWSWMAKKRVIEARGWEHFKS